MQDRGVPQSQDGGHSRRGSAIPLCCSDVGATAEEVRSAIGDGGYNGITLGVRGDSRRDLEQYMPKVGDPIHIRPTLAGKTEIDGINGTITALSEDCSTFSFEGMNELGVPMSTEAEVHELRYQSGAWLLLRTISIPTVAS